MIPKSVKVGPLTYSVSAVPADDMIGAFGRLHKAVLEIRISKDLADQKFAEVLIHEILHACYDCAGLDGEGCSQEQLVNAMGYQVLQLMQDNPDLIRYIQRLGKCKKKS